MRKPNYGFERRVRELEKQAKKAAKAEAKRQKTKDEDPNGAQGDGAPDQENS